MTVKYYAEVQFIYCDFQQGGPTSSLSTTGGIKVIDSNSILLDTVQMSNLHTQQNGAALYAETTGSIDILNSNIYNGLAEGSLGGGCLYIDQVSGQVRIQNSNIWNCFAKMGGMLMGKSIIGGLFVSDSNFIINQTAINNT